MSRKILPGGRMTLLSLLAVVAIAVLDALTGSGVVTGMLLVAPVIIVGYTDRASAIWIVFGTAWCAFFLAALFGQDPETASAMALNQVFVVVMLGVSALAALQLQRRRIEAQHARDAAIDAGEVNRLLMSLIAHDLRAPLATALHTFDYLDHTGRHEDEVDITREVKGRLRRSLRIIDAFLAIGGSAKPGASETGATFITGVQLVTILTEEVRAFEPEAEARGKSIRFAAEGLGRGGFTLNVLILRQAVAILVDNAVRYAVPGEILVRATMTKHGLTVNVEDRGPGLSAGRPRGEGVGLGLELCSALVRRTRGELEIERDRPDGTAFTLRLPIRHEPDLEARPA